MQSVAQPTGCRFQNHRKPNDHHRPHLAASYRVRGIGRPKPESGQSQNIVAKSHSQPSGHGSPASPVKIEKSQSSICMAPISPALCAKTLHLNSTQILQVYRLTE